MHVLGMIKPKRLILAKEEMSTIPTVILTKSTDVSNLVQESSYCGIDLSSDEVYQIHALSSKHPPPPRPSGTPKPPFRPQSQQSGPQKVLPKV